MLTSDEIFDISARAYHDALLADVDMRKAVDMLETVRTAMQKEKDYFKVWDIIDEQIGKTCVGACDVIITEDIEILQSVLIKLRNVFENMITDKIISDLHKSFHHDKASGWIDWLKMYADALTSWRLQICSALCEESFLLPESKKKEFEKFRRYTRLILHERWPEAYDFFVELANYNVIPSTLKARFYVTAGEIQLYHFLDHDKARALFDIAGQVAPDEISALLGLGQYYLSQNNIEEAIKLFNEIIRKEPYLSDGYTYMGKCYEKQNDLHAAEDWYKEAIKMAGGNTSGYFHLLHLYGLPVPEIFKKNEDKSLALVNHIKVINPLYEYDAYLDIGNSYKQNGLYEKAYEWFQKAIDFDSTRLAGHISIGNAYMDEWRYDLAYSSFQKALEVAPESFDPYFCMAQLCENLQKWEEAITWHKESISRRMEWRSMIIAKIAEIKWAYLKRHEEAENDLLDLLKERPQDKVVLKALHELAKEYYRHLNNIDSAIHLLNEIRDIAGSTYEAEYQKQFADLKFFLGEYQESVDAYNKAIAVNKNDAGYYAGLGNVLKKMKRLDSAVNAYQEAIRLAPHNADYQNTMGNLLFEMRFYRESVNYYMRAVNLDPDVAVYYANLGGAYRVLGQWKEAEDVYQMAIKLQPNNAEYHNLLGNIYFESRRFKESINSYKKAIELAPDTAVYYANLGVSYRALAQYEESLNAYTKANELDRQPIYESYIGMAYGGLGRWEEMIDHCRKAVELRREKTTDAYGIDYYYEYLAEAYYRAGRIKKFEGLFEASGDLDSEPERKAIIYNRIGNLLAWDGYNREAISYYEKAIMLDNKRPIYRCNLGLTYGNMGYWDKAIKHYLDALQLRKNIPADSTDEYGLDYYYEYLAEAYFKAGRIKEFEGLFEASGDLDSEPEKKAEIYNRVGGFFAENNQFKEAIPYAEKAIELDNKKPVYKHNLGLAYGKLGQWDIAIEYYLKAIELRRQIPDNEYGLDYYYEYLAEAYFRTGRIKEFEGLFEASGDLDSEPERKAGVYNKIGNLFLETYQYNKAIPYYKMAIKLTPYAAVFYANMGLALKSLQRYEEAENALKMALELNPEHDEVRNILGNVYFKQGKYEDAGKQYLAAIKLTPSDSIYIDNLILSCENMGDKNMALFLMEDAIRLVPDNARLIDALAKMRGQLN